MDQQYATITTPLALAALGLSALFGLFEIVLKKSSAGTGKLLVRYGFILALTLSVLANVSYIIVQWFGQEIRISGTVRDERGPLLPKAIVDIPGRGRGITDDYGEFQFSVPASRSAEAYKMYVTLDGYLPQTVDLHGRRPEPISFSLKEENAESVFPTAQAKAFASQYFGLLALDIVLDIQNHTTKEARIENVGAKLTGPTGQSFNLGMLYLR